MRPSCAQTAGAMHADTGSSLKGVHKAFIFAPLRRCGAPPSRCMLSCQRASSGPLSRAGRALTPGLIVFRNVLSIICSNICFTGTSKHKKNVKFSAFSTWSYTPGWLTWASAGTSSTLPPSWRAWRQGCTRCTARCTTCACTGAVPSFVGPPMAQLLNSLLGGTGMAP